VFTPVIVATQEAEIRRIEVRRQPRQIDKNLSQKNPTQKKVLAEQLKVKAWSSNPSTGKKTSQAW
jgi:hypothetical protein